MCQPYVQFQAPACIRFEFPSLLMSNDVNAVKTAEKTSNLDTNILTSNMRM